MRYYFRAAAYFVNRFILQRKFLTATADEQGMKFRFRVEDGGGRRIYKHGDFEPHITRFVKENLQAQPGDVLFDIGANKGWYSVLFSKLTPPGVKIYAFEPEPLNFETLCHNLRLNEVKNVVPVQKALAEKPGKQTLHMYSHKNTGRHSLLPLNDGRKIEVDTTTLDHFIAAEKIDPARVKFIKIDVEGYEYAVFAGAKKLLAHKPTIISEYAPEHMRLGGIEPKQILQMFASNGYACQEVAFEGITDVDTDDLTQRERYTNLCWKKAA